MDGGQPALGVGVRDARAAAGVGSPHSSRQRPARLRELAGELGAARVALERVDAARRAPRPSGHSSSAWPPGAGRVAVGVHRARLRRGAQRAPPARAHASRAPEPVGRDLDAARAARPRAPRPARRCSARRRSHGTSAYSASRLSAWRNAAAAGAVLAHQPALEQLREPRRRRRTLGDERRGRTRSPATAAASAAARAVRRQLRGADQHRVADGVGHAAPRRRRRARARAARPPASRCTHAAPARAPRRRTGRPACGRGSRGPATAPARRRAAARAARRSPPRRAARAPARRAGRRGAARGAAGAACGRAAGRRSGRRRRTSTGSSAERLGERGEQLERGLVGPLQVVEHDERRRAPGRCCAKAQLHRLEQRRPVARRRRIAELGQQQREVRPQRAEPVEAVRARRAGRRAARRRSGRRAPRRRGSRGPTAPARPTPPATSSARRVLPDAGLAGEEDQRARRRARARVAAPAASRVALVLAADERAAGDMAESRSRRRPEAAGGRLRPRPAPGRAARRRCRRPG